ncbi:hypothetical protein GCM10027168_37920 [Streptomyces capparidis]
MRTARPPEPGAFPPPSTLHPWAAPVDNGPLNIFIPFHTPERRPTLKVHRAHTPSRNVPAITPRRR